MERLSYEEAITQADQAMAAHEWDRAIALLRVAVRRADPARDPDKANLARYNMAFCCYMDKRYLRGGRPRRAPGPALSEGGALGQGDRDRHGLAGRRL